MIFELVKKDNVSDAINLQAGIFPDCKSAHDFDDAVNNTIPEEYTMMTYWLAKNDDDIVGIVGLYSYKNFSDEAWLGWYGVSQHHRGKGYGKQIISYAMQEAKNQNYKTLRLYTDDVENANAVKLYKKIGMMGEVYNNPDDIHQETGKTLIFSISLIGEQVQKWDNKNLGIGVHDKRNGII